MSTRLWHAPTAEAVYFYRVGDQQLWVGILWAGIFNLINIVQLTILTPAPQGADVRDLNRAALHSLESAAR